MIPATRIGLSILLTFLVGCAYQFGSGERHLPGEYAEVSIPVFKNSTMQPAIEGYFTNSLIREFNRSKIARVVPRSSAPIVIEGEITRVDYIPGGSIDANQKGQERFRLPRNTVLTSEYRVVATANVKLIRTSDRKVLWTGDVHNERAYTAPQVGIAGVNSVNPLYNHSARLEVIEALAQDMMAEVHDRMTENF